MEVPWKVLLKKKFKNVHLFIKDIEELLKHVGKDLRPEIQNYTYSSGVQKELFVLDGTIPITFRGVMYNIPLCVLLQEDHPLVPPLVYVRPTNSMVIIPSQHVDTEGRVYHPYLNEWDPVKESSDITSLIQIMCSTFSEVSPVYSKRPPRQNSSNNVTETQPRTRTANPSPRGTILLYSAISNFAGLAPGGRLNLSFVVGDEIEVVNKNDPEWWEGRSKRTGAVGYFPQSHVTAKATSCYEETTIREETHPTPPPATLNASLKNFNWFAGRRDRLQAEQMLSTKSDGTFLIRESVSRGGEYVLSVKVRSNVKHIKIPYEEGAFYLTKAISFGSIEELVDYYKLNTLGVSVPRVDTNLRQGVNEEPKIKDDQTDDYCIVCMELKKDSVFIPCGHLGICFKCASRCKETSKTCPICRKQITEVHRVYQP